MELTTMPCLGIKSFRKIIPLSSPFPKPSNYVIAETSERWCRIQLLNRHCHLNMRTGSFTTLIQTPRLLSLRPCQVKAEDSESSSSGENLIFDVETLERDLNVAIAEENYAKAAKIRDSLKLLQEDSKTSILATNARFYNAFRIGDLATMQTLWAKGNEVCCVHPGARGISGYDDVMTSWEYVWANYEFPLIIELKDVKVQVRGDMGYVTCVELVKTKGSSWGGQFVTNVFERIDGQWFICIHHASPIDL
ncbi:Polyketide cyclase SnoaL-like domain containing protein [Trema orientale]|uniref:Polyketide cyclase SnoaL-like domain containing protein n=1 Tax=Trema orientale TaxID=63057 RepID=A0A2P5AXV1_TREOI|nr:Polyketide cyclase SnoaL-like domain containing protein [Trema orientale]